MAWHPTQIQKFAKNAEKIEVWEILFKNPKLDLKHLIPADSEASLTKMHSDKVAKLMKPNVE